MTPKLSLKPFVLKSTFEFMINTAPQASNSAYGKEDCFKVNTFTEPTIPQQRNLWELTPRTRGVRISPWVFSFLCTIFFFDHIFSLWLVSFVSHCWPLRAWRGFCDNVFLVKNNCLQQFFSVLFHELEVENPWKLKVSSFLSCERSNKEYES